MDWRFLLSYAIRELRHASVHWARELWIAFIAAVAYEMLHALLESGVLEGAHAG